MANAVEEKSLICGVGKVVNETDVGYDDSSKNFGNESNEIAAMIEMLDNFYKNIGIQPDYVLVGLYLPVIVIATVANILVIVVIVKNQYLRSETNYFVINLSVADLFVTAICMPTAISQAISAITKFNEITCKLVFYSQGVAVAASVFTIMVMSIDRYMAIKNPISFRHSLNRKKMSVVIFGIWFISLGFFGPMLKAATLSRLDKKSIIVGAPGTNERCVYQPPYTAICHENLTVFGPNGKYLGLGWFTVVYAIPVFVILIVYVLMARTLYTRKPPFDSDSIEGSTSLQQGRRIIRERKRIAHVLLTLAVLFALCWFPYNILRVFLDLGVIANGRTMVDVLSYCLLFGHANSMLNPVVYCLMTRTFRRNISALFCQGWRRIINSRGSRNTLAVASWACSSRSSPRTWAISNRASLSMGDIYRGRVQPPLARARSSATRNSACDNSTNKDHRPHCRCYRYSDHQEFRTNLYD